MRMFGWRVRYRSALHVKCFPVGGGKRGYACRDHAKSCQGRQARRKVAGRPRFARRALGFAPSHEVSALRVTIPVADVSSTMQHHHADCCGNHRCHGPYERDAYGGRSIDPRHFHGCFRSRKRWRSGGRWRSLAPAHRVVPWTSPPVIRPEHLPECLPGSGGRGLTVGPVPPDLHAPIVRVSRAGAA